MYVGFRRAVYNFVNEHLPEKIVHRIKKASLSYFASRAGKTGFLSIEVHIVNHCNLNCKGCATCAPLIKEDYYMFDDFSKDCARFSELAMNGKLVEKVTLMGGEPLLHPRIVDFINISRRYFPYAEIIIPTNGLLLKECSHEFWESCHKNKILIRVTDYHIKRDDEAIQKLAKKYKVKIAYMVLNDWVLFRSDISGSKNVDYNFNNCPAKIICAVLDHGKYYICSRPMVTRFLNDHLNPAIPLDKKDYLDIYQIKSVKEIYDYISKPIPFCKYCNPQGEKSTWGISKKEVSEWVM
jgi:organic radical activating enzyme